jgi:hypothetical protein
MSSHSSRSDVRSIDSAIIQTAIGGTVLAGGLIFAAIVKLTKATRAAITGLGAPEDVHILQPAAVIGAEDPRVKALGAKLSNLPPLDRARIEALAKLAYQPYRISNPVTVAHELQKVLKSTTPSQLAESMGTLRQTVVRQHQGVFANGVARTCELAMRQIGFNEITVGVGPTGARRVVGIDDGGRTLVSEISTGPGRALVLETETVNVIDHSCDEILDRFDQALDELGLRSGDPKRRATGGICQTGAARAFIRSKFAPLARRPVGRMDGTSGAKMQPRLAVSVNSSRK